MKKIISSKTKYQKMITNHFNFFNSNHLETVCGNDGKTTCRKLFWAKFKISKFDGNCAGNEEIILSFIINEVNLFGNVGKSSPIWLYERSLFYIELGLFIVKKKIFVTNTKSIILQRF